MDNNSHAKNIQTFIDSLDDNQVKAFGTNGLAALDDETAARYYHAIGFTPPQPQPESFVQHELGAAKDYSFNDITGSIAKAGIEANKYLQMKAQDYAEQSGAKNPLDKALGLAGSTALATGSETLIPQNRLGVQLYGIQAIAPFISALSKAVGLTPQLENVATSAASKLYQYTGIPATRANMLAKNLEKVANPEDISTLNNAYKESANALGISKMEDVIDQAPGAYQKAVGEYTNKIGPKIVQDPINASYQDLHNTVESVSAKLDAPWAYPGTENMRTLPEKAAKELYQLKTEAQWGMLTKAMHDVGTDIPGSAEKLDAVEKLIDLRGDLAIAQQASKIGFTPSNLTGSANQLGMAMMAGGAGELLGAAVGHGSAGAATGIGLGLAGMSKSPMLMNSAILNARAGANFLPYAPGVAALANNAFQVGPEVSSIINNLTEKEPTTNAQ